MMRSVPRRSTIGFLMIVVAVVALVLAIPWGIWNNLGSMALSLMVMMTLCLGSFGLTVLVGKLAMRVGTAIGASLPASQKEFSRPEQSPAPPS